MLGWLFPLAVGYLFGGDSTPPPARSVYSDTMHPPLHLLSASQVVLLIRKNSLTVEEYALSLLARIKERDSTVGAWAYLGRNFVPIRYFLSLLFILSSTFCSFSSRWARDYGLLFNYIPLAPNAIPSWALFSFQDKIDLVKHANINITDIVFSKQILRSCWSKLEHLTVFPVTRGVRCTE